MALDTRTPSADVVPRERWWSRAGWLGAILILASTAAALRLYDLGYRSLWLDEIATAVVVRLPDLGSVLEYVARDPSATPLIYVVTWLLRPLGGDEFAIRLPYAVAGLLAVVSMFALTARLYGRSTGMVAASLLAILPFAIFYSQEARSYAILMVLSTLVMFAAHRAVSNGRPGDWLLLAITGALDLYAGYLAIAVLLAAYAYIGLVLVANVVAGWRASRLRLVLAESARVGVAGLLAAGLTGVLFMPWFPRLETFLAHRDQAFGRAAANHQATVDEALALLQQLDFHGILLWLLVVGIVRAVLDVARAKWRESLVPLAWLLVPLLGFAVGSGGGIVTIWPRYFGAIYPAGVLLCALGIDSIARVTGRAVWLAQRALSGRMAATAAVITEARPLSASSLGRALMLVGLVSAIAFEALPADAAAYTRQKGSDYRGAVDAMLAADRGRPLVLVLGANPDWTVSGIGYYGWVRGSRLSVLDALKVSAASLRMIESATSVWGAVLSAPNVPDPAVNGFTATLFSDIWLVHDEGQAGPIDQTRSILSWASSFEPELTASIQLIDVLEGHATTGPELLPAPGTSQAEGSLAPFDRWILQPGASLREDGKAFHLDPGGRSINVYLRTEGLTPGGQYLISFSCETARLDGWASVFVVTEGPAGQTAFPDGAGYQCPGGSGAEQGVFAFTVPDTATSAILWLRATGVGSATYESVSLRSLQ